MPLTFYTAYAQLAMPWCSTISCVSSRARIQESTELQWPAWFSRRAESVVLPAGFFVYGYCFYYYAWRSDMSGFMQVRAAGPARIRTSTARLHPQRSAACQ